MCVQQSIKDVMIRPRCLERIGGREGWAVVANTILWAEARQEQREARRRVPRRSVGPSVFDLLTIGFGMARSPSSRDVAAET